MHVVKVKLVVFRGFRIVRVYFPRRKLTSGGGSAVVVAVRVYWSLLRMRLRWEHVVPPVKSINFPVIRNVVLEKFL